MSTKKSIRLSDKSVEVIKVICQGQLNFNGGVNNIIDRYAFLMSVSMPVLSEYEKLAIAQSFNGYFYDFNIPISQEMGIFAWRIEEAIKYDPSVVELLWQDYEEELPLKGFEQSAQLKDFLKRVNGWSYVERMAVFHHITAF